MISLADCIKGRVYRLHSRNLARGVYDGEQGFIGIREKFGSLYLDTEYHWETGAPHGTASPEADLGLDVPADIQLLDLLPGTVDPLTGRPVRFDRARVHGGRGWYFSDTNEDGPENLYGVAVANDKLFEFLSSL